MAKYSAKPTKHYWIAVKRILRYLKGTLNYGLFYSKGGSTECVGFSDSDWGGDLDDRKSTSGYLFQISGAAVSWRSKKQTCVALSTTEAEYTWHWQVQPKKPCGCDNLPPIRVSQHEATVIFDNQAASCMAKNPQFHGRLKNISFHSRARQHREAEILLDK